MLLLLVNRCCAVVVVVGKLIDHWRWSIDWPWISPFKVSLSRKEIFHILGNSGLSLSLQPDPLMCFITDMKRIRRGQTYSDDVISYIHWWRHILHQLMTSYYISTDDVIFYIHRWRHILHQLMTSYHISTDDVIFYIHRWRHIIHPLMMSCPLSMSYVQ